LRLLESDDYPNNPQHPHHHSRRAAGDRGGGADTLDSIGSAYNALGEKLKALEYYNQSLQLKVALGNRGKEALTLSNIGSTYNSRGAGGDVARQAVGGAVLLGCVHAARRVEVIRGNRACLRARRC
jgi:hypothetical protein